MSLIKRFLLPAVSVLLCTGLLAAGVKTAEMVGTAADNDFNESNTFDTDNSADTAVSDILDITGTIESIRASEYLSAGSYSHYYNSINDYAAPEEKVTVKATEYSKLGTDTVAEVKNSFENVRDVLTIQTGAVYWEFDIQTEGLYKLGMYYYSLDNGIDTEFTVTVDGESLFNDKLTLKQFWKDAHKIIPNDEDNQIRPKQVRHYKWTNSDVLLKNDLSVPPYFYLSKGKHTLEVSGNLHIAAESLYFYNNEVPPSYAEIKSESEIESTPAMTTAFYEAEEPLYKTSPHLYATHDDSSYTISPSHPTKMRYNTIGKDTWNLPGQAVTWEFIVPNDGYYKFSFKVKQSTAGGLNVYRKINIDGETPCSELLAYPFEYSDKWYTETLTDKSGDIIHLPIKAGKHTITLEAVRGIAGESVSRLDETVYELYKSYAILSSADKTPSDVSDTVEKFKQISESLKEEVKILEVNSAGRKAYAVESVITALNKITDSLTVSSKETTDNTDNADNTDNTDSDENNIIGLQELQYTITSLCEWINLCRSQSFEMDFFEVASPAGEFKSAAVNALNEFSYDFKAFMGSFFEDYESFSETSKESVNVLVCGEQKQIDFLRDLIDSDFERNNPFNVILNYTECPLSETVLADRKPDVALYLDEDTVISLAEKGLLIDFSKGADYVDAVLQFADDAMEPFTYRGGVYATPLSVRVPAVFYRSDILTDGINNTDGITLRAGMVKITDMYSNNIPIGFRTGENPIFVQNYAYYYTLLKSALELRGKWDFTVPHDNGNYKEYTGAVVFKGGNEAAALGFVKWFTQAKTQTLFADFANVVGISHISNIKGMDTANLEALKLLWNPKEYEKIITQILPPKEEPETIILN